MTAILAVALPAAAYTYVALLDAKTCSYALFEAYRRIIKLDVSTGEARNLIESADGDYRKKIPGKP